MSGFNGGSQVDSDRFRWISEGGPCLSLLDECKLFLIITNDRELALGQIKKKRVVSEMPVRHDDATYGPLFSTPDLKK